VVAAHPTGAGIDIFTLSENGTAALHTRFANSATLESVTSLALAETETGYTLLATSGADNSVSSFSISTDGTVSYVQTMGVRDFLPISAPQDISTVTVDDQTFAVMASSGSSSLTVLKLDDLGYMTAYDQIMDDLDTRLQGAHVIETFTVADRGYVLAAGQDSGISLFGIMPDGQLVHLDTIADQTDYPIDTITDMHVQNVDGDYQLFTVSGSEAGIGQFTLDFDHIGMTAVGDGTHLAGTSNDDLLFAADGGQSIDAGAGKDVIKDADGADTLTGGDGKDIFIFTGDGAMDTLTDFNPAQDQLDLSGWPFFRNVSQLSIVPTANGAVLQFGAETLHIVSATQTPLTADDFTNHNTINATHVDTSLIIYDDERPPSVSATEIESSFTAEHEQAGSSDQTLIGDVQNNTLIGDGRDQYLIGGLGQDVLRGGAGADALSGGDGFDLADYANAQSGVTANLADTSHNTGDAQGDSYDQIEGLTGSAYNDHLTGNQLENAIFGAGGDDIAFAGAGHDKIEGGDGHDWLDGGTGNDLLDAGDGNDSIVGRTGADEIIGGDGDDNIAAFHGHDLIYGGDGQDSIGGNAGRDSIYGGAGDDTIGAGADDDVVHAGAGDDLASAGWGADMVMGGSGADTIEGSYGRDTLYGGDGNDAVFGGGMNDAVYGGEGDDLVYGGAGNNILFGGEGADTYIFTDFAEGQVDRIEDFSKNIDLIQMQNVEDGFDGLRLSTLSIDGQTYAAISYDGHQILLADTDAATLTPDDFIFLSG